MWSFTLRNKLGSVIKTIPLPDLPFTFQTIINDNILQPGWTQHPTASAFHVSASDLQNPCPRTLSKALEEHNNKIQHICGRPIPLMCVCYLTEPVSVSAIPRRFKTLSSPPRGHLERIL